MKTVIIVLAIVFIVSQAISEILGKIGHRETCGNEEYWDNELCEFINYRFIAPVSGLCILGFFVTLIINYVL